MSRKVGYYWVQSSSICWEIARWEYDRWVVCGSDNVYDDDRFIEIQQFPINMPPPPFVDKDMGHGKCREKGCTKFATTDYNGHGYWVCDRHDERLNEEFEDEYK